jgi:DNA-binding MarR family transcriptional regulator
MGSSRTARKTATSAAPLDRMIWSLGRAYYSYVGLLEQFLAASGLNRYLAPGMGHVLFALYEQDDRSAKDIAARVQLSCSTLTGLMARMERSGLIERRRDANDGRVVRVRLTPLGRSLEPRCRAVVEEFSAVLQSAMGDEAMEQAKRLLQQLTEIMRAEERRRRRSGHEE